MMRTLKDMFIVAALGLLFVLLLAFCCGCAEQTVRVIHEPQTIRVHHDPQDVNLHKGWKRSRKR